MTKQLFKIPTRKKPKSARFVIGPGDPNKKQTIPRGYGSGGYAAGLCDTNVVGAPVGSSGSVASAPAVVASGDPINPPETLLSAEPSANDSLYKYGCVMVDISDAISKWLNSWCRQNIKPSDLFINQDCGIDGYEDSHHVSLLYGIVNDDPDAMNEHLFPLLDKLPEFEFGDVSRFSDHPDFDVLTISLGTELHDIHSTLSQSVAHEKLHDTFTPHITLAYLKKDACKHLDGNRDFNGMKDKPLELVFSTRSGSEHVYGNIPE